MEAIKLKKQSDETGLLTIQLPADAQGIECEVIVLYEPQRKMTPQEWEAFINETYGSLADDPIERGADLPFEMRDEIE
ncbi:MAG: hypothetical protein SFZ02_15365 [bacterium]|nr:hypothetical protein [bacterium]